jgi:hypothetical protein
LDFFCGFWFARRVTCPSISSLHCGLRNGTAARQQHGRRQLHPPPGPLYEASSGQRSGVWPIVAFCKYSFTAQMMLARRASASGQRQRTRTSAPRPKNRQFRYTYVAAVFFRFARPGALRFGFLKLLSTEFVTRASMSGGAASCGMRQPRDNDAAVCSTPTHHPAPPAQGTTDRRCGARFHSHEIYTRHIHSGHVPIRPFDPTPAWPPGVEAS